MEIMKHVLLLLVSAMAAFSQTADAPANIRLYTFWGNAQVVLPQYAAPSATPVWWIVADAASVPEVNQVSFSLTCDNGYTDGRVSEVHQYGTAAAVFALDKPYAIQHNCKVTVTGSTVRLQTVRSAASD